MKNLKKIFALVLAVMMIAAMSVSAFAATVSITSSDDKYVADRTFRAYQVFNADWEGSKITNITAGNGINWSNVEWNKIKAISGLNEVDSATELAEALNGKDAATGEMVAKVLKDYIVADNRVDVVDGGTLNDGYYLIIDETALEDKDDVKNAALLQVAGDTVTIDVKTDKPTIDKKIKHNEKNEWDVVGDNQIGDTVEFRLEIPVPDVSHYDSYTYTAYDKLGSELTLDTSSVKVYSDADLTQEVNGSYISVDTSASSAETFKVTVTIKSADGTVNVDKNSTPTLYIGYKAVLNNTAKIYTDKQENEAWLTYSNNPDGSGTGETTHKKVYDWTFKIAIDKFDGKDSNKTPIAGATFVISKDNNLSLNPATDGTLTAEELTNMIKLIKVNDTEYRVANGDEDGAVYYIDTIAGTNITINGLDDATDYYLYETKAPTGYNRLTAPVNFKIAVTYDNDGSAVDSITYTNANDNGVVEIENNQGSTLPSTGGIGTTIFYVLGSVLVLGAGIVLVTRKRMGEN